MQIVSMLVFTYFSYAYLLLAAGIYYFAYRSNAKESVKDPHFHLKFALYFFQFLSLFIFLMGIFHALIFIWHSVFLQFDSAQLVEAIVYLLPMAGIYLFTLQLLKKNESRTDAEVALSV